MWELYSFTNPVSTFLTNSTYPSVYREKERKKKGIFLILKGYFLKYFYASHNVTATDGTYSEI